MIKKNIQARNNNTTDVWLLQVFENGKKTEYNLDQSKRYSIGRESSVDIILLNSEASRKHAELSFLNGQWVVKDLGSTNGVKVKQEKISTAVLVGGDSFDIASTKITILSPTFQAEDDGTVYNSSVLPESKSVNNSKRIFLYIVAAISVVIMISVFLMSEKRPEKAEQGNIESTVPAELPLSLPAPEINSAGTSVAIPTKEHALKVQEYYRIGLLAYDHGHLKKAIIHWNKALSLDRNNDLIIQKVSRATEELDYQISERYRSAINHLKYLRYHEAEQNFMIVMELVQDETDSKFIEAKKQLELIQKK